MALEAGWIVTEVGRQPWIVYQVMRTSDALTTSPGIWGSFAAIVAIYAALAVAAVAVLRAMARRWRMSADEADVPYGPSHPPASGPGAAGP